MGSDVAYPSPAHPSPHSRPAALMKPRGPSRSISQPSSGWTQVWNRMNSVKANWMSDSFQCVLACIGFTNSVHAYCRFAIMIIATSDAHSWNQRLLIFTPSLLTHPDVVQTFRSARHGGPEGPHYFLSPPAVFRPAV